MDLANQSKNIDFSGKPMVKPFRSGTQLPATCVTGEMFFNTNAAAGSNSFGCTAPNTWTLQGSSSSTAVAVAPLQATLTNSTALMVGSACSTAAECTVRIGSVTYYYAAPATINLQSGTGTVFIYVNNSGALTAGIADSTDPAVTCSGCQVLTAITQFPPDSIPLATWHATLGAWDANGTDEHALLSGGPTFIAGPNIILSESGNAITISATAATTSVTGTTGPSTTYDPTDMTEFDRALMFSENGYGGVGWGYGGGCGAAGPTPGVAGEVTGLGWGTSSSQCVVYYPGGGGSSYPFFDFISGTTPLNYSVQARYAMTASGGTVAGTHYIGWSSNRDGTFPDFVGLRYLGSSNIWECVIRAGSADVAAQVLPVVPDGAVHTFAVSNNATANSVSCKVDSASTTAAGAIPSSTWYFNMGAASPSGGSSGFTTVEARIHITGIQR